MHWFLFLFLCALIVTAGRYLARDGEILAEKTGMGRTWIGAVLVAATTSLPELFAGFGATAVFQLPEIAVGDILGSCMFNLLILSMMDAISGKQAPLSARASPGHALAIGFGCILVGVAGIGIVGSTRLPAFGWIGMTTPFLLITYLVSTRVTFQYERRRSLQHAIAELMYAHIPLRTVCLRYASAAAVVVTAAIFLPEAGAAIAADTVRRRG